MFQDAFRNHWSKNHLCDVAGCGKVLTVDGGLKPHGKLCAAKLAGIKHFESSGLSVVTGCTSIPCPQSKFCNRHQEEQSPALLCEEVSKETRKKLRDHRTQSATSSEAPQDNIYVIESILGRKVKKDGTFFNVKWLNFPVSESTWENEKCIPKFIQLYYEDESRFGKILPNPKLKKVKKAGTSTYHLLSWEGEDNCSQWVQDDFFNILSEDGEIVSFLDNSDSCNTRKSRDKVY